MSNPKTVLFVTGQTGAGKTAFLRKLLSVRGRRLNIVCSDLMHLCREFPVLSNNEVGSAAAVDPRMAEFVSAGARFHFYGSMDVFQATNLSSVVFARRVREVLDPEALNVIEGGNSYYLNILAREIGTEWTRRTVVLFYDHLRHINTLTRRSKEMVLGGGLDEVIAFEDVLAREGLAYPAIKPIGYDTLRDFLESVQTKRSAKGSHLTDKEMAALTRTHFTSFVKKQRAYSTLQLKYLRKYFTGPGTFWFNVVDDAVAVARMTGADVLDLPVTGQRPPELSHFERSVGSAFCKKADEGIQVDFRRGDLEAIRELCRRYGERRTGRGCETLHTDR